MCELAAALSTASLSGWACDGGSPSSYVCGWQGVGCTDGDVTSISLPRFSLQGVIPNSIELISKLTYLDLSGNSLSGSLPSGLCSLSLSYLSMQNNNPSLLCYPACVYSIATTSLAPMYQCDSVMRKYLSFSIIVSIVFIYISLRFLLEMA